VAPIYQMDNFQQDRQGRHLACSTMPSSAAAGGLDSAFDCLPKPSATSNARAPVLTHRQSVPQSVGQLPGNVAAPPAQPATALPASEDIIHKAMMLLPDSLASATSQFTPRFRSAGTSQGYQALSLAVDEME
jgi:hypothetical protein